MCIYIYTNLLVYQPLLILPLGGFICTFGFKWDGGECTIAHKVTVCESVVIFSLQNCPLSMSFLNNTLALFCPDSLIYIF